MLSLTKRLLSQRLRIRRWRRAQVRALRASGIGFYPFGAQFFQFLQTDFFK